MLTDAFAGYLASGATPRAAELFAEVLAAHGLTREAQLLAVYAREGTAKRTFEKGEIYVGSRVPVAAKYGDYWLDTCELSMMILLPFYVDPDERPHLSDEARVRVEAQRAWFALHPVRAFQYRAAAATAAIETRDAAVSELDAVTGITCEQAGRHLHWFGKHFPNETHWLSARDFVSEPWGVPAKEWIGESAFDDTRVVAVSSDTLELDPEAHEGMQYAATASPRDLTFRSAVLMIYGLQSGAFHRPT